MSVRKSDKREDESAYQRVARDLRTMILGRELGPSDRLPTEAELAELYSVSRQTVRRAMQDLVFEGMIYRVPGRGTFPTSSDGRYLRHFGTIEDLLALSSDTTLELIEPLHRSVDIESAGRLRLTSDIVSSASFRRLHGETPLCHTTIYLPPPVATTLAEVSELNVPGKRSTVTVIGLLDATFPIAEAEQSITAAVIPAGIAEHLDCLAGEAALRIDRLYFDVSENAVELAISYFLPRHYSYRLRLRRSS